MAQVEFQYKETTTIIKCQLDEKLSEIIQKFIAESKTNKDEINYFYEGKELLDETMAFNQIANSIDKARKKMNIVIMDKKLDENNSLIKSKQIICPKCQENIRMNINNFKINLFDCKNNHNTNNILLNEIEICQMINITKIICGICKDKNKANTLKNEFYRCYECNINLCPSCKQQHDNKHSIQNYDKISYFCNKHNNPYNSYCKQCKKNICHLCVEEHKNHDIILFEKLKLKKNDLLQKKEEFKKSKDEYNNNLDKIIELLSNAKNNINNYYKIEDDIINNYDENELNYELLYNLNEITNYNNIILKDINIINSENKIESKFNKILSMCNQNNTSEKNEIKLTLNIDGEDKYKKIYFLDNTDGDLYINGKWEKHHHDFLKELNESNVELYINNNKQNYKKYFIPEKDGIYEILLKFNIIIKDCGFMFYNCTKITDIDLSLFDTAKITNMGGMFYGCSNLKTIDVSLFDTKNVNNMGGMFYNCSKLTSINLSTFNTKNVKEMGGMFLGCSNLQEIDLSSFNTLNVVDMNGMFYNCFNLKKIKLSSLITKNVTNMSYMFYKCSNLDSIDLSSFETKNVINMESMFYNCSQIPKLNLSSFDTKNVTNMSYMFNNCSNLTEIDLSRFDTQNIMNMGGIFDGCSKLESIKLNKSSYDKLKFYINEDMVKVEFA